MKKQPKRSIKIEGIDKQLQLSKYTVIKNTPKNMIHLDELPDGSWRLIVSENVIPDMTQVEALRIIREE